MQSKLEKVVAGLKTGPRFLKELREFDNLVKAIGECKSKAEEDRIISQELELLKQRLSDPKLDKSRGKEYMIRLIYCEMLGHDASFAYIKALQFASDPNIHTKKAAYLALTQFLDYNNQLVLLLVNTLLLDMKSDNYLIVCTALVAATKLIGADLINAVYPVVVERLRHPKEHVRKKAVLALHWFGQLDPRREGPLAGVELEKHFRTMLCDKDPSVMSAALCALHDCIKADPRPFKNLIPSFTSILKQVSEHRLPKTYDYHRFPAPFVQIKLLKILALLGAGDRSASDNMAAVLHQTLRRANTSHTIGSAIIYECVRTITTIYPNPQLLAAAAESIATFLRSPSHNLRYVGIDALAGITALNPAAAADHQVAVLDCLEDPDDTLKLKTLELLYKMTKANNIQVIVDKMMSYLSSCTDDHIRKDIVRKVCDLAERYAPSPAWFVTTISEVFRLGGEHVGEADAHRLMALIAEQDAGLHASAVEAYLGLLDEESGAAAAAVRQAPRAPRKKLPETILLVICWVLGEYGHLARRPPLAVLSRLIAILTAHKASTERVRCTLLTALTKLAAHTGGASGPVGAALLQPHGGSGAVGGPAGQDAAEWVHKCLSSQSVELQQRAHELQVLLSCPAPVLDSALPPDASCQEFTAADLAEVATLPFLEHHVASALAAGAAPYLPPEARGAKTSDAQAKGLRFEAYEPAPFAVSLAAASTSYAAGEHRTSTTASAGPTGGSQGAGTSSGLVGPSEPQLVVKAPGGRKWGPVQYESDRGSGGGATPSGQTAAPPSSSSAAAGSTAAAVRSGGHTRTASGSAALSGQALERERLAASLFGGSGSGGGSGGGGAVVSTKLSASGHKHTNGAAAAPGAASQARAQTTSAVDLLLDLDVPAPAPAAASGATRPPSGPPGVGDWMDSLMGGGGGGRMTAPTGGLTGSMGMGMSMTGPTGPVVLNGGVAPMGAGALYGMPSPQPALSYMGPPPGGLGMGMGMAAPQSAMGAAGPIMGGMAPGGGMGLGGMTYGAAPAAVHSMQSAAPVWQPQAGGPLGMGHVQRPQGPPHQQQPHGSRTGVKDPFGDLLG